MEKVKAIFFDIDGTLVDLNSRIVPDSLFTALNKLRENGVLLFICSGRNTGFLKELKKEINFEFDGYILMNGQYVICDGKCIHKLSFDKDTVYGIYKKIKEKDITAIVMEENYVYGIKEDPHMTKDIEPIERMLENTIYQVCPFIGEEFDQELVKEVPGCKSARWNPNFADIIPSNGGKDKGIDVILKKYGIDLKNTMAFGDGGNDIPMLKKVHYGIAMGNAFDIVKASAYDVTDSVLDDGIYNALKKYQVI